jgi:transposase
MESLSKLDQEGVELIPPIMPPFPWHFGGQRFQNLFVDAKVDFERTIHSDGWKGYNGLVDLGYKKHYRAQHGNNEFANKTSHINCIENFWGIAKICFAKFQRMSKSTFYLHLKECEVRFNHRGKNRYKLLLKVI